MTLEQKEYVLRLVPSSRNKVFILSEFAAGIKEIQELMDEVENTRLVLENKRRKFLERNGEKLEELQQRNLELSRQMRALDEELRRIEQKMDQETASERQKLEELQSKITSLEIPDPYGQNIEAYQLCAMEIKSRLKTVVERIKESLEE
jgi:protein-tyrosine-phosphatase